MAQAKPTTPVNPVTTVAGSSIAAISKLKMQEQLQGMVKFNAVNGTPYGTRILLLTGSGKKRDTGLEPVKKFCNQPVNIL